MSSTFLFKSGLYAGEKIDNIPTSYLEHCIQQWSLYPTIKEQQKNKILAIEKELQIRRLGDYLGTPFLSPKSPMGLGREFDVREADRITIADPECHTPPWV